MRLKSEYLCLESETYLNLLYIEEDFVGDYKKF